VFVPLALHRSKQFPLYCPVDPSSQPNWRPAVFLPLASQAFAIFDFSVFFSPAQIFSFPSFSDFAFFRFAFKKHNHTINPSSYSIAPHYKHFLPMQNSPCKILP